MPGLADLNDSQQMQAKVIAKKYSLLATFWSCGNCCTLAALPNESFRRPNRNPSKDIWKNAVTCGTSIAAKLAESDLPFTTRDRSDSCCIPRIVKQIINTPEIEESHFLTSVIAASEPAPLTPKRRVVLIWFPTQLAHTSAGSGAHCAD